MVDGAMDASALDSLCDRAALPLGPARPLPHFSGRCIGDDVTSRRSRIIRIVSLQSAGHAAPIAEWAYQWGLALIGTIGTPLCVVSMLAVSLFLSMSIGRYPK